MGNMRNGISSVQISEAKVEEIEMKRKTCFILFLLLILLNAYDVYSTNALLNSNMGFHEANPIVRYAMEEFGQIVGMVGLKFLALLWLGSFLFCTQTKRLWNVLLAGLLVSIFVYGIGMYFVNYESMLLLESLGG